VTALFTGNQKRKPETLPAKTPKPDAVFSLPGFTQNTTMNSLSLAEGMYIMATLETGFRLSTFYITGHSCCSEPILVYLISQRFDTNESLYCFII
jgi:hypothetical protein